MSLSLLCLILVLISIAISVLPTMYSDKRFFYYCKTVFTLQFVAGLSGVTDIFQQTLYGNYIVSELHIIMFICIFLSAVSSYILKTRLLCSNLDSISKYE